MPYTAKTTRKGTCAICKKDFPKGTIVYFDATKSQGSHLAHKMCYDDLMATRRESATQAPRTRGKAILSSEPLDPPF